MKLLEPPSPSRRRRSPGLAPFLAILAPFLFGACAPDADVVLYCSLDQVHAEELVRRFERESGLRVRAEYDVEAQKTVGLVQRLLEERGRPRCDVFWNNEVAHTVRLADEGLFAEYASPSAADIPARWRDPKNRWTGFAARARVFIVNTEKADAAQLRGLADLADPRWKDQSCMARPLTGTTLTHATALYEAWGEERTREFLRSVRANAGIVQSNGQVMRLVREGRLAWGLTDTDDFNVAREGGYPVAAVFPDQGEGELGTLLIPNTVAVLAQAPHPDAARRLVDFILSREVEAELARSDSAQIPLRSGVPPPPNIPPMETLRVMEVDWQAVGRAIARRHEELKEMFLD
jgi:iron(III) transport system substrate-binding protein